MATPLTRGERVCKFIHAYCRVPEGKHVGKPLKLLPFQRQFILDIYDNPAGTSRAYLSIARKNGKTGLIACIVLAHLVGPEAKLNSQIISGARSRDQAALVFKLAEKMARLNPDLIKIIKPIPSSKTLVGLTMNVEYKAISAEAGTAHGLSPILAILDEVGQVKGPQDAFVEAIETAQGAHDAPILIAISTQAATDGDLFSRWLDDAAKSKDPRIVSHLYAAPDDCGLDDRKAWLAANPAMGEFRSIPDLEDYAERAMRSPTAEQSFRWLFLNQRVEASSPFVSRTLWSSCGAKPDPLGDLPVYGGLDLSSVNDLTALVLVGQGESAWHVHPTFWLPADGLRDKARADRVPYDVWNSEGFLETTPGKAIEYEYLAEYLRGVFNRYDIRKLAFDRWGFKYLRPWLVKAGFSEEELERFVEFGQGYQSMTPAMRELEVALLGGKVRHGMHPVLTMCAANAVVHSDPAGNRKLDKAKSSGRIDGMVALTMAAGTMPLEDGGGSMDWSDIFANVVSA
jgi:phage terminase large subunit-like protein